MLVTGAGSGIGREIAYRFADENANVVVSDMNETGGAETVAGILQRKGRAIFLRADTSNPKDSDATVRAAVEEFGAVHIAVNNAGIGGASAPVGEYPIDSWDRVIAVNLSGVFYGMRYQIPGDARRRRRFHREHLVGARPSGLSEFRSVRGRETRHSKRFPLRSASQELLDQIAAERVFP